MYWRLHEEDGIVTMFLDSEAIDYFMLGLEKLRDADPDDEFSTPNFEIDDDGVPTAAGETILKRVADVE